MSDIVLSKDIGGGQTNFQVKKNLFYVLNEESYIFILKFKVLLQCKSYSISNLKIKRFSLKTILVLLLPLLFIKHGREKLIFP